MEKCNVDPSRLMIDRNACIVKEEYARLELEQGLRRRVGSTASGTGIGVAKRALRDPDVRLAKNSEELVPFLGDVSAELNEHLDHGANIIVEGTQGFGLSLYHTDYYPYATSRDTTVSGFLSETGLAPTLVDDVIMAVRTFPIRVEGESGPLKNEITWEELRMKSGYPHAIMEQTTATGRIRRLGHFDMELVRKAAQVNRPTRIALHGADYLDYRDKGITVYDNLSERAVQFIESLEESLKVPTAFIGTGPKNEEIIDRRKSDVIWQPHQVQATLKA
jgi:adenylosuccinate synthase